MDTKKVIEKLVRIAVSQQKIINKLAQAIPEKSPFVGQGEPPPQELDPNRTQKKPADALKAALPTTVKPAVVDIKEQGSDMLVTFGPGQKTQKNYDAVLSTLQQLTNQGVIQHAYNLKVV